MNPAIPLGSTSSVAAPVALVLQNPGRPQLSPSSGAVGNFGQGRCVIRAFPHEGVCHGLEPG
jgi:hypothetical protein